MQPVEVSLNTSECSMYVFVVLEEKAPHFYRSFWQDSGLPSSLVPMKPPPDDGLGPREQEPGSPAGEVGTPTEPDWEPHQATPEGEEGEEGEGEQGEEGDSSSSSFQISEALTNHFYYSNGVLRPKPHSNAILSGFC